MTADGGVRGNCKQEIQRPQPLFTIKDQAPRGFFGVFVTYNGNLVKSEGMESASTLRKLTGFLSLMAFMRSANKLHASGR